MIELNEKLELWCVDVYKSIRKNFATQRIFPFEVYPGYNAKNASRKGNNRSSGEAYDKLYWNVYMAANGNQFKIDYFYKYYLNFVDMGVGRGQSYNQVSHGTPASNDARYRKWDGAGDRQSRPAVSMEFNYQISRLFRYYAQHYAIEGMLTIVHALGDDDSK
jgi:hypothetical protein